MTVFTSIKKSMLFALLAVSPLFSMGQTVLLSEDFSKCDGSYSNLPAIDNMDDYTQVPGWTGVKVYQGPGVIKMGTTSVGGSITTPALDLSDATATYTLTFKACAWLKDAQVINVAVDDNAPVAIEGLNNAGGDYSANFAEYSLNITGTASSKITISSSIASKGRFFVDDLTVTKLAKGEVADPEVKVPDVVSFGAVNLNEKVEEKVVVNGTNLTADLNVAVSGEGFSCATTTISKDEAAQAELVIVFAPTEEKEYIGQMVISGGGLAENVVVELKGSGITLDGNGTADSPYSVADLVKLKNPGTKAWVKGYIVGTFVNNSPVFSYENASNSNLILADNASETDIANCVAVQLSSSLRPEVNLQDNPSNLGRELSIAGTLEAYFGVIGLKSTTEYVLGEGGTVVKKQYYEKASSIESGSTYIMVYETETTAKVAQKISGNYGFLDVEDVEYANGKITLESKANGIVFTEVEDSYAMVASDGRFFYMKGDYNNFNMGDENSEGNVWSVTANADGTFKILNNSVNKYIQYNSEYNNFGSYADEQGGMPCLYKYVGEEGGTSIGNTLVSDNNAKVEVYSINGVKIADSVEGLKRGIYIVKKGSSVNKIVVR